MMLNISDGLRGDDVVTLSKYGNNYNMNIMEIDGLSTAQKPTDKFEGMTIPNGSLYTEIDTDTRYMFDAENKVWYETTIGSGGGRPEGGIVLVGETITALIDGARTNPITVNGNSYTAQSNDAAIYGNKEFLFDGTKWHEFGDLSGLSSKDIGAMTNYVKAQIASAIDTTDTLNQAIGKVEKRVDVNENNISSEQSKTAGMTEGGSNYITVGGIRVYVSATAPTGDIPDGSVGIGW